MFYLLLFTFLISNNNLFINQFYQSNSSFFDAPIKRIDFDYSIDNNTTINPMGFIQFQINTLNKGQGILFVDQNRYKILLDDYIILYYNQALKTYNKKTNQIFIQNSISQFDSLIFNFFNNSKNILLNNSSIIDFDNNSIIFNKLNNQLKFFIQDNSISKINWIFNDLIINIAGIQLSEHIVDNSESIFQINDTTIFILDLRD